MIIIPGNIDNRISKISEIGGNKMTLFLGGINATSVEIIKQYKINAVLTVASGLGVILPTYITHKTIQIQDNVFENIAHYFSQANDFIDKNIEKGNVLVHCKAGISRSASIVTAYLMKRQKLKLKTALTKVSQSRGVVKPNQGFMQQLKQYQLKLKATVQGKGMVLK